eukprot:IDg21415t1
MPRGLLYYSELILTMLASLLGVARTPATVFAASFPVIAKNRTRFFSFRPRRPVRVCRPTIQ